VEKCIFGDAWAVYEKAKAKERQQATQAKPGEGKVGQGNVSLTEPTQSRDAIGARVGVSLPIRQLRQRGFQRCIVRDLCQRSF
jgi:hypothetical protein